ncbi:MAG: aldo/keto reductase [Lachnospiraceae bacterium]
MNFNKIQGVDGKIRLDKVILGAASFGANISKELSYQMMDRYYEIGGRTIDTARFYAMWIHNGVSRSEKMVGDWVRDRGVRDEMTIITKGGHPEYRNMTYSRLAPECIEYDINTSLCVLGMDYVDVYCLHRDDERTPVNEIVDVMDNVVKEGFAKSIGVSNWSAKRLNEANEYAKKHNKTMFSTSQIQWSMAKCRHEDMLDKTLYFMDEEEYEAYLENKIPVMAYSPQAVGFFSKYLTSGETNLSDRARMYCTDINKKRAEKVRELCDEMSCTPAALCIAYLTCNPVDGYAVISNSTMKQMEDTLTGVDLKISQDIVNWILK